MFIDILSQTILQDVHISQQKAEAKQRALLVIETEAEETPEKPKRRILCRSTHDKTKKDCCSVLRPFWLEPPLSLLIRYLYFAEEAIRYYRL